MLRATSVPCDLWPPGHGSPYVCAIAHTYAATCLIWSGVRFDPAPRGGIAMDVRVMASGSPAVTSESIGPHSTGTKCRPRLSEEPLSGIPIALGPWQVTQAPA